MDSDSRILKYWRRIPRMISNSMKSVISDQYQLGSLYRRGIFFKRANVKFHYGLKNRSYRDLYHPEKFKALSCLVQIFKLSKGECHFRDFKKAECHTIQLRIHTMSHIRPKIFQKMGYIIKCQC